MNQRNKLERLCGYITRLAIADERLARNKDGQIVLTLKAPYRDGTTHIVMSPLEFMQRLAALVPWLSLNLIRFASFRFAKYLLTPFHGVLAPNAKLRAEIIPVSKTNKSHASNANDAVPHSPASVRISWARLLKGVFIRYRHRTLLALRREYENYLRHPGESAITKTKTKTKTKTLNHLGLPARAPPRSPAKIQGLFDPS